MGGFPACDESVLREGMKRVAQLDSILLVHAEDPLRLASPAGTPALDLSGLRLSGAELQAISLALAIAGETECRLHIVHVSTARGVELIHEAQQGGVDASGETCPHYLLYVESDLERMGGIAKCAPPLRTPITRQTPSR